MERWFKANSPEIISTLDGSTVEKKGGTSGSCGGGTTSGGSEGVEGKQEQHHHSSSVTMTKSKDRNVSPESNNDSQKSYQFCRICHEGKKSPLSFTEILIPVWILSLCILATKLGDGNCSGISPTSANSASSGPREALIAPCRCTGSVAMVHLSCLEHWLTTSNSEKCELCHFVYKTKKMPRTWTEHLLVCRGSPPVLHSERWEAAGLITLSFFLLLVYFTWCHVTFKYHIGVWQTWERTHQRIRITFGDGSVSEFRRRVTTTASSSVVEMREQRRRNNRLITAMEEGHGGGGRAEGVVADTYSTSSTASFQSSEGNGGNEEMMEDDGRYDSTENLYIVNTNNSYNHRFPLHINRHALLHHQQPTFVQAHHHHQQPMSSFFPAPARETHFPVDDGVRRN
ncbi:E3 ubiquitin-protein ligase MARCH3 [Orchesella cincta]|uniref:E3 ubiquitin-protein ligase MARCH3 n=1 Tax=Orchesella cincta TaxID=48709 RepID=A0A1D2NG38_ORCCI|nr:E3 ubiquitin-protein ligase MARCH3 [Orchesella cincta]